MTIANEVARAANAVHNYNSIMDWWDEFDRRCEEEEYTDTDLVWEFMEPHIEHWREAHQRS